MTDTDFLKMEKLMDNSKEIMKQSPLEEISIQVDRIDSKEDAEACMSRMKTVEAMLDEVDRLGTFACQFCYLEARMLVNIASLGIDVSRRKAMIAWLRCKSVEETDALLAECASGVRLHVIKSRETRIRNMQDTRDGQLDELKRISNGIICELEETGRTSVSSDEFYDRWSRSDRPDNVAVRAFVERTRDAVLARGGASTGTGEGTYAIVSIAKPDERIQMIQTRVRSIHNDMVGLRDMLVEANMAITSDDAALLAEDVANLENPND